MAYSTKKRQRFEDTDDERIEIDVWPRYLVIKPLDNNTIPKNPFLIQKTIESIAGNPKSVRRLQSGDLQIEVDKKKHSDNLLRTETFAGVSVVVEPHRSLNSSKGLLRDKARVLEEMSDEEIVDELAPQGVNHVRRLTKFIDGKKTPINTYIITFATPLLPEHIKIGYMKYNIEIFIPFPLRCRKCQKYGHHEDKCRRMTHCVICGQENHNDDSCINKAACVNCHGDHAASSKNCPEWATEKEVQRIKHTQRISFPEARKIVTSTTQQTTKLTNTYAQITKSSHTIGVQTEPEIISTGVQSSPTKALCTKCSKCSCSITTPSTNNSNQNSNMPTSTNINCKPSKQSIRSKSPVTSINPKDKTKQQQTSKQVNINRGNTSNRPPKGSNDPIKLHNKFGSIGQMEVT